MCVYLIFTPLCIHCKFKRSDSGGERTPAEHRLYVWEGYAFTEVMSVEEEKRESDARASLAQR